MALRPRLLPDARARFVSVSNLGLGTGAVKRGKAAAHVMDVTEPAPLRAPVPFSRLLTFTIGDLLRPMETSTKAPVDHPPSIGSNIVLPGWEVVKYERFPRKAAKLKEVPSAA